MKYNHRKLIIPKWVSCHTYLFGTADSRTYISNEKSHTYVLLESLASDMWKLLLDKTDEKAFEAWAEKSGVTEQVDEFIESLAEQGLVSLSGGDDKSEKTFFEPFADNANGEDEAKFVEEMQKWLFENKFMFSLFFELTYRCNLKCVHCYNPKDMQNVELDFDLCRKAIDDAYDLGCFRITFSGGEATLHTNFLELLKYARSKHISVEIFTNGQTLEQNEELYNEVIKQYPYRICISLYGIGKDVHESVTAVNGSFEKSYDLICKLRKENVNVQIKNFLLNSNCRDCIKVKEFAKGIGATSIADISLIPTIKGDKKTMQYAIDNDELFNLFIDPNSPLFIGNNFKPIEYEAIKDESPCFGGFSGLCVNPDGQVVICVSLPLSVGDLRNSSIKSIWLSAMRKSPESNLYQWHQVKNSDLEECHKNDYCAFCNYCAGMGYLENGYLKHSDVQCNQAKIKMKAYNYLKNKRK